MNDLPDSTTIRTARVQSTLRTVIQALEQNSDQLGRLIDTIRAQLTDDLPGRSILRNRVEELRQLVTLQKQAVSHYRRLASELDAGPNERVPQIVSKIAAYSQFLREQTNSEADATRIARDVARFAPLL